MRDNYRDAHMRILKRTFCEYKSARKAGEHQKASGRMLQVKDLIHSLRKLK